MSKQPIFKYIVAIGLGVSALACGSIIYFSYLSYINPKQVYGSWVELNAPDYRQEILTLNDKGVFRNNRLVSTSFEYDGKNIEIKTGKGRAIYALAGTTSSPQLKRIQPALPVQRFIKHGFENTVDIKSGSEIRRSSIQGHFNN